MALRVQKSGQIKTQPRLVVGVKMIMQFCVFLEVSHSMDNFGLKRSMSKLLSVLSM